MKRPSDWFSIMLTLFWLFDHDTRAWSSWGFSSISWVRLAMSIHGLHHGS